MKRHHLSSPVADPPMTGPASPRVNPRASDATVDRAGSNGQRLVRDTDDPARHRAVLPGSIGIDMDSLRDYASGYGLTCSPTPDPVYTHGLVRFLDLFAERGIRATLFVIGRDTQVAEHRAILERAVAQGHELANHTQTHPRNLSSLGVDELQREVFVAHDVISELRGSDIIGFRAPCYDVSGRVLDVLEERGYRYDSSVHPTIFAAAIDAAVLCKSGFRKWQARPRTYAHVAAPLVPYRPSRRCMMLRGSGRNIMELPLSVVPGTRLPFYGTFVQTAGMKMFAASLVRLRKRAIPLNFHFHAVELLGLDDPGVDPGFAVHPGMKRSVAVKTEEIGRMLDDLAAAYDLTTLERLVATWPLNGTVPRACTLGETS